jgi:hypothetical protein
VFGCGDASKGSWLSTYAGPFIPHSNKNYENTRWYIRKRYGGCDSNFRGVGRNCFKPNPGEKRGNSNGACPY